MITTVLAVALAVSGAASAITSVGWARAQRDLQAADRAEQGWIGENRDLTQMVRDQHEALTKRDEEIARHVTTITMLTSELNRVEEAQP